MSLTYFSPKPNSGRSPPSGTNNPNDGTASRLGLGAPQSPLSHPTLLGQLHQEYPKSPGHELGKSITFEDDKDDVSNNNIEQEAPGFSYYIHSGATQKRHHHVQHQHLYVLPVLLLEFLAIALTRAVLPSILLAEYGSNVYLVLGSADCIRGLLAFFACPLFGKLSDLLGRRLCLFVTVLGSCAPVCSLAFFSWDRPTSVEIEGELEVLGVAESFSSNVTTTTYSSVGRLSYKLHPMAIPVFVILLSLSGLFSSTFTLVFAYISDSVRERDERVSAYGLALATFGLSFTIGPMAGGYLAPYNTSYVFQCSILLTILDLIYIYYFLPESKQPKLSLGGALARGDTTSRIENSAMFSPGGASVASAISTSTFLQQVAESISWSPLESIKLVLQDPFLRKVGQVAFFYYTGLWAVISTLSLYAVQHFSLTPERLGELMSALGLSTMVAEAVLVRVMVPLVGEKRAIRIGLFSFALQCLVLGGASQAWQLFVCVGFSLLGNLVYPSLSSLVSGTVPPESVGEALGAINGIKALTEGLGPLFFGALMTASEHTAFPGAPYWLAGVLVFVSYHLAGKLPASSEPSPYSTFSSPDKYPPYPISPPEEDYIHELEFKRRYNNSTAKSSRQRRRRNNTGRIGNADADVEDDCLAAMFPTPVRDEEEEEYQGLLSEIEESDENDDVVVVTTTATAEGVDENLRFAQKPSTRNK